MSERSFELEAYYSFRVNGKYKDQYIVVDVTPFSGLFRPFLQVLLMSLIFVDLRFSLGTNNFDIIGISQSKIV